MLWRVYSIEIPKGAFESFGSSEDPLDAAKRELREETGVVAERWVKLGTVYTLMESSDDVVHFYLATDLSLGESAPEGTEDISVFIVPLSEGRPVISYLKGGDAMETGT